MKTINKLFYKKDENKLILIVYLLDEIELHI
jgi:hypothetical protein